jgi:DUF1680 family protein
MGSPASSRCWLTVGPGRALPLAARAKELAIRVPVWSREHRIRLNGDEIEPDANRLGYLLLRRRHGVGSLPGPGESQMHPMSASHLEV